MIAEPASHTLAEATPAYLTVKQVRSRFNLSHGMVYSLITSGKLRSISIGKCRRIPVDAVIEFEKSINGGDVTTPDNE